MNKQPRSDVHRIFSLDGGPSFDQLALEVFRHQFANNAVYAEYCSALAVDPDGVCCLADIPFLPVELFKNRKVYASAGPAEKTFSSSGTTGSLVSKHHVARLSVYEQSFRQCFRHFYGDPRRYCILALLPGYLERRNSSLVYMARGLMDLSGHPEGGFYLDQVDVLAAKLRKLMDDGEKVLLLGVSHALLELAERHPMPLPHAIVMETGGMKGRRREMVRNELHAILCDAFTKEVIHSEYGMTELLSQAYSKGRGFFACPPWMRVLIRDTNDPLSLAEDGRSGGINVIDLANIHSCSFIATQDLGRMYPMAHFQVLGRFDHSDTRGCNLLLG